MLVLKLSSVQNLLNPEKVINLLKFYLSPGIWNGRCSIFA